MSTRVCSLFGINGAPLPKESDLIVDDIRLGIEVEQEYEGDGARHSVTRNTPALNNAEWRVTRDGSLRNYGVEFVSNILYPYQVRSSLQTLLPVLDRGTYSWRSGIHVHVECADMSAEQLRSMAQLYAVMEPLIFAWEGTNRQESRFCVPWYTAPRGVHEMFTAINSNDADLISMSLNSFGKYTSLNMIPLTRQGTVEFRHMQTTGDLDKIIEYVNMCLGIVSAGKQNLDALSVLSSSTDAASFISSIFGDYCPTLGRGTADTDLLWRGVDVANTIAIAELRHDTEEDNMEVDMDHLQQWIDKVKNKEVSL